MQLSKVLLVLGATSVSLVPLAGRAADKASVAPLVAPAPAAPGAVEKARAAMRQKMDEIQDGAPADTAPAPAKAVPAPVTSAAPAPVAPGAVEKARAAVRQKMDELQAGAPTATAPAPATPVTPAPAAPVQAFTPRTAPAAPAPDPALIPAADPAALAKARAAMHRKMAELNSQPEPAPKAPQTAQAPQKPKQEHAAPTHSKQPKPAQVALTKAQPAQHALNFEPLSGPPSPLSAEKQQRLSDLLSKYKADQITPEQYHHERARILAQP